MASVGAVSIGAAGAERQLINLAPGTAATDAATLGQVTGLIAQAATPLAVQCTDSSQSAVNPGGSGGTLLGNLAPGALNASSSDAINGSQLFTTDQNVAANTGSIGTLQGQVAANTSGLAATQAGVTANAANIAAVDASAVQYDNSGQTSVTLQGAGGTLLTNLAAGTVAPGSSDAVTGAQLAATKLQVAQNTSAIAAINPQAGNAVAYDDASQARVTLGGAAGTTIANLTDGAISAISDEAVNGSQLFATNQNVAVNTTAIATLDGRVTNLNTSVQQNSTQIAQLNAQVANVPVRYASDADPTVASSVPTSTAALVGAGGGSVRLTNVTGGTLAAGSTDAVDGGQLATTNAQVASNRADIDQNSAAITAINNNLAGSCVAAVQYSDPSAPTVSNGGTITNDVALVGANPPAPVALHNVANGTLANDAVNLGQLQGGLSGAITTAGA